MWKVTFENDTEVETIGTAKAFFVDANGKESLIIEDRINFVDQKTVDAFKAKAIAVKAEKEAIEDARVSIASSLTEFMNN